MSWQAYGDESEPDPATYVLSAVVVHDDTEGLVRDAVAALRSPSERKLRWHNESPANRRKIIAVLASLPAMYVVAVRRCHSAERPVRRRAKCLATLLSELDAAGVDRLVLEARQQTQNNQDLRAVAALRSARRLSPAVRVEHLPGPAEPLLWTADIVAGAVGAALAGDREHVTVISDLVQIVHDGP
jgi:hypothetical protein